jgi:hypothetical protein
MRQETLSQGTCLALDESPEGSFPCPAGSLTGSAFGGLAHYTGRSFERPVISHSVHPKIYHRHMQVKQIARNSIHISCTWVINNLLIPAMQEHIPAGGVQWICFQKIRTFNCIK